MMKLFSPRSMQLTAVLTLLAAAYQTGRSDDWVCPLQCFRSFAVPTHSGVRWIPESAASSVAEVMQVIADTPPSSPTQEVSIKEEGVLMPMKIERKVVRLVKAHPELSPLMLEILNATSATRYKPRRLGVDVRSPHGATTRFNDQKYTFALKQRHTNHALNGVPSTVVAAAFNSHSLRFPKDAAESDRNGAVAPVVGRARSAPTGRNGGNDHKVRVNIRGMDFTLPDEYMRYHAQKNLTYGDLVRALKKTKAKLAVDDSGIYGLRFKDGTVGNFPIIVSWYVTYEGENYYVPGHLDQLARKLSSCDVDWESVRRKLYDAGVDLQYGSQGAPSAIGFQGEFFGLHGTPTA